MDTKMINDLIEQAKKDPKFFHSLIFEPDKVLGTLGHLDKKIRGSLVSANTEELFARILGLQECGNTCTTSCDNTCGQSCGFTTNLTDKAQASAAGSAFFSHFKGALEGCGNTCSSSCDNTCGQSCGFTTNFQDMGQMNQFAQSAGRSSSWKGTKAMDAGCGNTCSSSCDNTCGQSCGYTTNFQGDFGGGNMR